MARTELTALLYRVSGGFSVMAGIRRVQSMDKDKPGGAVIKESLAIFPMVWLISSFID